MPEENFTNTLYTNDNLFILNGLNTNLVDLIYLDPPFNTKRLFSAPIGSKAAGSSFKDMWSWEDVNEAYLETLAANYPVLTRFIATVGRIHSNAMMAYLTYMAQRIVEMHRVLKDTGSLYLHCDPTASHYLKVLLDEIFGKNNFRNEITWKRNEMFVSSASKKYDVTTDIIFFYTKTNEYTYNPQFIKSKRDPSNSYKLTDENGKKYQTVLITGHKTLPSSSDNFYEYNGYTPEYGWNVAREKLIEMDKQGLLLWKNGVCKRYKKYLDARTEKVSNLWTDIITTRGKERTGYPTQKPLALLQRIIKASSNEGGIVMDPFCGCATACVAAQQLGRKWIGIDVEVNAVKILIERLSDDAGIFNDFVATKLVPQRTDIKIEPLVQTVKERLYKKQNGCCNGCGVEFEIRNLEIDHIIPKAKGGGDYCENYQLLCGSCNRIKGTRTMEYLRMKIARIESMAENKVIFGE
ncbi:MAG: HNH endonuclease [Ignavibacteria bacterium]|jgi:site-specific DNA-methyltransferase (adenine-specific)|nr:HNH endonuclease [Ignavibacteria bacterium]